MLVTGAVTWEMVVVTGAVTWVTVLATGATTCETVLVTGAVVWVTVVVTGAVTFSAVPATAPVAFDTVLVIGAAACETGCATGAAGAVVCDTVLLIGCAIGAATAGTGALTGNCPAAGDTTPDVMPAAAAECEPNAKTAISPKAPAATIRRNPSIATPERPSHWMEKEGAATVLSPCIATAVCENLPYLEYKRWRKWFGPQCDDRTNSGLWALY